MNKPVLFKKIITHVLIVLVPIIAVNSAAYAANKYATAKELGIMQGFPPPPDKQVTKANALMTPPFIRWSYQHMRMVYPSANIPAAKKPVPITMAIDSKFESGVTITDPMGETKSVADFLKETWSDALVVIKGDKIVYENYQNGMTPNTPHQMMSVTKSFGGLLGLMAVADGKLKGSDLVSKYVPQT